MWSGAHQKQITFSVDKKIRSGVERSDKICRKEEAARPVTAERRDLGQIALSRKEDAEAVWSEATEIMFERLNQIEAKYDELTKALSSPEVIGDSSRYQKTA
ncbi:MAG TPA: hypothetical protein VGJ51_13265, partial [Candidatus Angelobacter sp.]